jgi:uncharacterized repeat protein (TIGR01451 family)
VQEAEDQDICTGGGEIYGTCSTASTVYADGQLDVLQDLAQDIYIRSGNVISYQTASDRAGVDYRGIIVGFLYRADRVELVPTSTLSTDPVLGTRPTDPYTYTHNTLVLNPKAMQATASLAAQSDGQGFNLFERLPQVALFRVHRTSLADADFVQVYAIGNHFKSTPDSYVQRRTEQANYNAQLVADIQAVNPSAQVAVLGDLNDYEIPPDSRYSYVYQGQTQTLDQIFGTGALTQTLVVVRAAHINADWSYDYQTINTTIHQSSDHDPIVATFAIPGPYLEDSQKSVNTTTANPGDVLTYTITLSNTGTGDANAVITDVLPAYVTLLDAGQLTEVTTGTLKWTGAVIAGASVKLVFTVKIKSLTELPGTVILHNTATINDGFHTPFNIVSPDTTVRVYKTYLPILSRN